MNVLLCYLIWQKEIEIFLDFLGEPNIITRVLKRERGKKKGKEGGKRESEKEMLLAFKREEEGHKPRNASSPWMLGRQGN